MEKTARKFYAVEWAMGINTHANNINKPWQATLVYSVDKQKILNFVAEGPGGEQTAGYREVADAKKARWILPSFFKSDKKEEDLLEISTSSLTLDNSQD